MLIDLGPSNENKLSLRSGSEAALRLNRY